MGQVGCVCPHDLALSLGWWGRPAPSVHLRTPTLVIKHAPQGRGVVPHRPRPTLRAAIFIWGTPAVYWVVNSDDEAAHYAPDELG